jgi:hypothetical protein
MSVTRRLERFFLSEKIKVASVQFLYMVYIKKFHPKNGTTLLFKHADKVNYTLFIIKNVYLITTNQALLFVAHQGLDLFYCFP